MKTLFKSFVLVGALSCGATCGAARADVKLPALFSDNMVLQRNMPLTIWGWADAGEAVTVKLGDAQAKATADATGNWKVKLPARAAGEGLELDVTGKNAIALKNVAMGEVWICSGQSNMEFGVGNGVNAAQEIEAANYPNIRLFTLKKTPSPDIQTTTSGQWQPCTPATIKSQGTWNGFTAVGYFFGRELHQKLNVPIGLIQSSWGGTPVEAWTSRSKLESLPAGKSRLDSWDARAASYAADLEKYNTVTLPAWQKDVDAAKADGKPEPRKPGPPATPDNPNRPANLFNGMIAPIVSYPIKGAIWYQGESNAGDAVGYRILFPGMITDWRERWGEGDFPFLFVQLANFQAVQTKPVEAGGWPMIRESQARTLALPHTGMATAIDLADANNPGDIHPKNKQDVGKRLALVALATEYGQAVPYAGPTFERMAVEGGKIRVTFKSAVGLMAKGDKLNGFAIAGADNVWQWADATIDGQSVVLSSAAVPAPTQVRYDWAINPIGNLYNGAGLPAFPFRTDVDSTN